MENKFINLIKRILKIAIKIFIVILILLLLREGKLDASIAGDTSSNDYLKFYGFNPDAKTGTKENPFIILEIVPYRGMGQIGYLIGGQEPVDPSVSTYENQLYGVFNGFAQGAFEVKTVKKDVLDASDNVNAWTWKNYQLQNQEGYFEKLETQNGLYDKLVSGTMITFVKNKYGKGNYRWVIEENINGIPTDYNSNQIWMKGYTLDISCYENNGNWMFENKEIFKRNILHIAEEDIDDFYVRVVTITPEELRKNVDKFSKYYDVSDGGRNHKVYVGCNEDGEIDLIGNADLINISPSAQAGNNSVIDFWEKYGRDRSGISTSDKRYTANFGENDLDWQTVMELFMKVAIVEDKAPLVYDITCYDAPKVSGVAGEIPETMTVGCLIGSEKKDGYLNNLYKLLFLLRQRNPVEVYNLYMNTNDGEAAPTVTMTTVKGKTTGSFNLQNNENSKVYWNTNTFLPPFPDGTYPAYISQPSPNYQKYLVELNIILGWSDKHDAVIRNTYSYNGTSNMVQRFIQLDYGLRKESGTDTKVGYNEEFFNYLNEIGNSNASSNVASPCDAVEYILKKTRDEVKQKYSITVLDLEPSNDFKLTVQQLRNMIPAYTGYIQIIQQTTAEFIGKNDDLNATYDLIYIGTNTGKMNVDEAGLPVYNDPLMDGLVYSHVGDRILGYDNLYGVLKEGSSNIKAMSYIDFTDMAFAKSTIFRGFSRVTRNDVEGTYLEKVADFYRFAGNDITKLKLKELEDYISGGYPVLLEGKLFTCDNRVVDDSSNLYQFLYRNKGSASFVNKEELFLTSKQAIAQKKLYDGINKEKLSIHMGVSPVEFQVDVKSTLLEDRLLKYEFRVASSLNRVSSENYNWSIFVDSNADNIYEESEKILSGVSRIGETVSSSKAMPETYAGAIPWKLVVVKQGQSYIRSEKKGYAAFKTAESTEEERKKTRIHILQINSEDSTLNLERLLNPPSGKSSLLYEYTKDLDDFNVSIKTMAVSEFLALYQGSGNAYDKNQPVLTDKLYFVDKGVKKPYDMLIFGFGDSYSDIKNDNGALYNIQAFIDSGRSVMFTHDTTSFVNTKVDGDIYDITSTGKTLKNWGYGINQYLRSRMGLDRFGVMGEKIAGTPYDIATMPSKVPRSIYKSGALTNYQTSYPEIQGFTYGALVAYNNPSNSPLENIYQGNVLYPPFLYGNAFVKGTNISNYETNYATRVNEGRITNYPYKINTNIKISSTHTQYYQVNMEDPTLVVWYCLSDNEADSENSERSIDEKHSNVKEIGAYSVSPNDVRNNYYIYSKGNIVFSGMGHSKVDGLWDKGTLENIIKANQSDEKDGLYKNEVKLFINTLIATYHAGASAPSVSITNEEAIKSNTFGHILYEDSEGAAKVPGATKQIKFIAEDKNASTEQLIVRVYNYDVDGTMKLLNPSVKKLDGSNAEFIRESGKEPGYRIQSGVEYCFDFPLDSFSMYGMDKLTIVVTNANDLTGSTNATLQNLVLFDLD